MGKAKAKSEEYAPDIDATPERIAYADAAAMGGKAHGLQDVVDLGARDQRKLSKHRRFKDSRIDMLYGTWGCITWAQWYAGTWWRERVEVGMGGQRLCADYGQSMGGGTADPSPLPLSDKAEAARRDLALAKRAISLDARIAIEDVLDDPHASLTGDASRARLARWRNGLQALAVYLKVTA